MNRRVAALALSASALLLPLTVRAAASAPVVELRRPEPQAHLRTFYPVVSASIRHADLASVHLFVDGNDVSAQLRHDGDRIEYVPVQRLSSGWHDVFIEGMGAGHRRFNDAWVFQTEPPDIASDDWSDAGPIGLIPVGVSWSPYGGFLHYFFIGPGDGFAVLNLCAYGAFPFQHAAGSPVFIVTVPFTPLTSLSNCAVTAFFTPLFGGPVQYFPLGIAGAPVGHTPGYGNSPGYIAPPAMRTTIPVFRTLPPSPTSPVIRRMPSTRVLLPGIIAHPAVSHGSAPRPITHP